MSTDDFAATAEPEWRQGLERFWEQTKDKRDRALNGTVQEARLIHGDRRTAKQLRILRYSHSRPAEDAATRLAIADEVAVLSDLALRSKAYWLYDDQFLEDCRDEPDCPC